MRNIDWNGHVPSPDRDTTDIELYLAWKAEEPGTPQWRGAAIRFIEGKPEPWPNGPWLPEWGKP